MHGARGRPRHPDLLTPAEWRVAEQLREGKTNAEIAVRLGVSVNTVRYHVSNILGKLGFADRGQLRGWDAERPRRSGWWPGFPLVAALLSGTGIALAATVIAFARGGEPPPASALATAREPAAEAPSVQALPFEQHADFREYARDQLLAAGFVDTGQFIRVPYNPYPAAMSSYRAAFTTVEVAADGYVEFDGQPWRPGQLPETGGWASVNAIGLTAEIDGAPIYLILSSEWGVAGGVRATRMMRVGESSIAFFAADLTAAPNVIVAATDAAGRPIPAIVDVRGDLWLRVARVPTGPTANDTGELLFTDHATALGPMPEGVGNWSNLTWCAGATCYAVIHVHTGGGLPTLVDGVATCEEGENSLAIQIAGDSFVVRFEAGRPNAMAVPGCEPGFPRSVSAGELLSKHPSWVVTAFDADGRQLDVAADDRGGMLYMGVDPPAIRSCPPCYTGN
jgi:DNA-binding CsgD family transcriptional regulator